MIFSWYDLIAMAEQHGYYDNGVWLNWKKESNNKNFVAFETWNDDLRPNTEKKIEIHFLGRLDMVWRICGIDKQLFEEKSVYEIAEDYWDNAEFIHA